MEILSKKITGDSGRYYVQEAKPIGKGVGTRNQIAVIRTAQGVPFLIYVTTQAHG